MLAGTFLVAGLATLSLPGLAPFISEFLVLIGTFTRYPVFAVVASTALVLSAIYILWMYQRMMTGPVTDGNDRLRDLRAPRARRGGAADRAAAGARRVSETRAGRDQSGRQPHADHHRPARSRHPSWRKDRRDEPANAQRRVRPAVARC